MIKHTDETFLQSFFQYIESGLSVTEAKLRLSFYRRRNLGEFSKETFQIIEEYCEARRLASHLALTP
jgi:hypothetical protein